MLILFYTYPTNWFESSVFKKIVYDAIITNAIWEVITSVSKKYVEVISMEKVEILLLTAVIIYLGLMWGGTYFHGHVFYRRVFWYNS